MDVHIHQPWGYRQTRGVDDSIRLCRNPPVQYGNPAMFHQNVLKLDCACHRMDYPAVLNQELHCVPPKYRVFLEPPPSRLYFAAHTYMIINYSGICRI